MIIVIYFSIIKPSFIIEVDVATIVASYFAYLLSIFLYLAFEIFLCSFPAISKIIVCFNVIRFICERNLSLHLMIKCSDYCVIKSIIWIIVYYCMTIFEFYSFVAYYCYYCWIWPCEDWKLNIAWNFIIVVWADDVKVTYGWMVTGLLHVELSSVSTLGLKSFA